STSRSEHRDALATLDALTRINERAPASRARLASLATTYRERGDELIAFTLSLWVAHADAASGRAAAARRGVAAACAVGAERQFRVGTSWWAPELAAVAREYAPPELSEYAESLVMIGAAATSAARPTVVLARDGDVTIAGAAFDAGGWREGRSGSGVLRRYFRVVLSAYPAALARDELADLLWPESEGDRAIRNLYDATKDLR